MFNTRDSQKRVAAALVAGVFIALMTAVFSFYAFQDLIQKKDKLVFDYSQRQIDAEALGRFFEEKVAQSRAYMLTGNEDILLEVSEARKSYLKTFERLQSEVASQKGIEFLRSIESKEAEHEKVMQDMIQMRKQGRSFPELTRDFQSKLRPHRLVLKEEIDRFIQYEAGLLQAFRGQSMLDSERVHTMVITISVISITFLLAIASMLFRTLRLHNLSERRFLDLVNHLDHSIVWEADVEPFRFNFISERMQHLIGLSPLVLVHDPKPFFMQIHEEDREKFKNMLAKATHEKLDQRCEHRMVLSDGKISWFQTGVHIRKDAKGKDEFYGMMVDITPIKNFQNELKDNRDVAIRLVDMLTLVADAQPTLIAYIDQNYIYQFANKTYGNWFNISKSQVLGKKVVEVVGQEIFQMVKPYIDRALKGEVASIEKDIPYPTGRRYIKGFYTPDVNSLTNRVEGVFVSVADVTEEKRAAERVQQSEREIRGLVNSLTVYVSMLDLDGTIIEINRAAVEVAGLQYEQVIGIKLWDCYCWNYSAEIQHEMQIAVNRARSGELVRFDAVARVPEGKFLTIDYAVAPMRNEKGDVIRIITSGMDISERKQIEEKLKISESRLRHYLEDMPAMAFIVNPQGRITYFNRQWLDYVGRAGHHSPDENWIPALRPDDMASARERWFYHIGQGKPFDFEFMARHRSGQYRWVLAKITPIRDLNGEIVEWYGTNQDIHDYKTSVQSLKLERDLREKFVNMLTHDLRTPLSAVKMASQILSMQKMDPIAIDKLSEKIRENVNRMDKMIQDLLDTNRIKAGKKLTLKVTECDMVRVIRKALEDYNIMYGNRFEFHGPADFLGHWDEEGLRRVLDNLVNNAIKYGTPNKTITIGLESQGSWVELSVHNWGGQLTEEEIKKLFNQFNRAKAAEKSGKIGWGIGLTLVKGIAESHGGRVRIQSEKSGTKFSVVLPRDASRWQEMGPSHHPSLS